MSKFTIQIVTESTDFTQAELVAQYMERYREADIRSRVMAPAMIREDLAGKIVDIETAMRGPEWAATAATAALEIIGQMDPAARAEREARATAWTVALDRCIWRRGFEGGQHPRGIAKIRKEAAKCYVAPSPVIPEAPSFTDDQIPF